MHRGLPSLTLQRRGRANYDWKDDPVYPGMGVILDSWSYRTLFVVQLAVWGTAEEKQVILFLWCLIQQAERPQFKMLLWPCALQSGLRREQKYPPSHGTLFFIHLLRLPLPCSWTCPCTDTKILSSARETHPRELIAFSNVSLCLIISHMSILCNMSHRQVKKMLKKLIKP